MKYFSMFSGIGGFENGIEKATDNKSKDEELQGKRRGKCCDNSNKLQRTTMCCVGYSEIDKYAEAIYRYHWPEHKNFGDATRIDADKLSNFDFLVGGFPCQSFSIAGKRGGFQDCRGTLFFEIARIISTKRPKLLLLENVRGLLSHDNGKTFGTILSTLSELGYILEWQILNSKNFGVPQNRERVFIIGHFRGKSKPKVFPIRATNQTYNESSNRRSKIPSTGQGIQSANGQAKSSSRNSRLNSTSNENKSRLKQIGQVGKKDNMGQRIYDTKGISTNIRAEGGGQGAKTGLYQIPRGYNKGGFKKECGSISSSAFEHNNFVNGIRRLTPTECERLQGFPDGWTKYGIIDEKKVKISDTQRYRALGNAVTTNVIEEIMRLLI